MNDKENTILISVRVRLHTSFIELEAIIEGMGEADRYGLEYDELIKIEKRLAIIDKKLQKLLNVKND